MNIFLNILRNSCLDISSPAQQVQRQLHDSQTVIPIFACTLTLHLVVTRSSYACRLQHSVTDTSFVPKYAVHLNGKGHYCGKMHEE